MTRPDDTLFFLQQMIIDLSLIDRRHYLAGTDRRENDIEHSASVMLLCWYIHDHYEIGLDITRIIKYALVHDFVERYAGDVNTYASAEELAAKVEKEREALTRLSTEFAAFPDLVRSMQAYEDRSDDESLFVWTVDKMQALIMGDMDNWRPYAEIGINYQRFHEKFDEIYEQSSPYLREITRALIDYSRSTYYDRPANHKR